MAVSQSGSAAGGAVDARLRPMPVVPPSVIPQPVIPQPTDPDRLLDAVRRGLTPGDPVARLLAGLVAPPARAVCTTRGRPTG